MTPRRILIAGWLVFLLYAYPGFMPLDSIYMVIEARLGVYSDKGSPLMSALWNLTNIPLTGAPGMLLVQSGGVLFGGYVLLRRVLSDRAAAIASAAILVFPPVMASLAVISPDAVLASALVGAAALFTFERRWVRLAGLAVIVLACGLRSGSWLAALPVMALCFTWRADHRGAKRYGIALGAWAAAALLAFGLGYVLVDRHTGQKDAYLAIADITGTLAYTDDLTDEQIRALAPSVRFAAADGLQARARAFEDRLDELFVDPWPLFVEPRKQVERTALIGARRRIRAHDPHAYASWRFAHWQRLLVRNKTAVHTKDNISRHFRLVAGHAARPSPVQKALHGFARLVAKTPLFSPIVYLVVALVLLVLARDRIARAFAASGIVMAAVLALVTWDVQYRYMTWPVVATLFALVLVIKERTASASRG